MKIKKDTQITLFAKIDNRVINQYNTKTLKSGTNYKYIGMHNFCKSNHKLYKNLDNQELFIFWP